MRQTGELELDRSTSRDRRALTEDVGLAVDRHLALLRELRRGEPHVAELLRNDGQLRELRGQLLADRQVAPRRHRVGELHERDARGERTLHLHTATRRDRLLRRSLEHRQALRTAGSSKIDRCRGSPAPARCSRSGRC